MYIGGRRNLPGILNQLPGPLCFGVADLIRNDCVVKLVMFVSDDVSANSSLNNHLIAEYAQLLYFLVFNAPFWDI